MCAVGLGAGALPAAAALNWVLKGGMGQLASVVCAAVISDQFDGDPKRWRFTASLCEDAARMLEVSCSCHIRNPPLRFPGVQVCSPLVPGHFLVRPWEMRVGGR